MLRGQLFVQYDNKSFSEKADFQIQSIGQAYFFLLLVNALFIVSE